MEARRASFRPYHKLCGQAARDEYPKAADNLRTLYGLPRKFNVAFDGGGAILTLEDTNDIGFQAVEIEDGATTDPGIWFKLIVGGITGHRDLARETG